MLGRDHALSGALVFAALGPSLHVTGPHLVTGVAIAAGAGVLPDLDHPDSTIAQTFGFLTEAFAWVVRRISGGHRHGTHALVGIAVFTAGAVAAGWYQLSGRLVGHAVFSWHMLPAALYLALLYSAALRALHIGGHHGDLLGIGAAVITCYTRADLALVPVGHWHVPLLALAIGLGTAAHIAGDELTHGGCPSSGRSAGTSSTSCPARCRSPPPSSARTGSSSPCSPAPSSSPSGTPPATRCDVNAGRGGQTLLPMLAETARTPRTGTGKPERLKHLSGEVWSRRITEKDRLVYDIHSDVITIIACRFHYDDH
jgi:Txe/YoeB family toxin of toxin-antitoxin system